MHCCRRSLLMSLPDCYSLGGIESETKPALSTCKPHPSAPVAVSSTPGLSLVSPPQPMASGALCTSASPESLSTSTHPGWMQAAIPPGWAVQWPKHARLVPGWGVQGSHMDLDDVIHCRDLPSGEAGGLKPETMDHVKQHQMLMLRWLDHTLLPAQSSAFTVWIHLLCGTFTSFSSLPWHRLCWVQCDSRNPAHTSRVLVLVWISSLLPGIARSSDVVS